MQRQKQPVHQTYCCAMMHQQVMTIPTQAALIALIEDTSKCKWAQVRQIRICMSCVDKTQRPKTHSVDAHRQVKFVCYFNIHVLVGAKVIQGSRHL